ncbi:MULTISPECIES: RICIN domain-containing protein [Pseudofrankia]|uniref:RICIN domain-containing protein n=1 Tax=Pseudofrankia TaxID=2994363 RepID=UPI00030E0405|nr:MULTISPECIES: hypothetical protein [Pseudofrankia]OHV41356.1 hypothetical protein BCD49_07680 [Pseudofrankia sp. EUN1h]
MKSSSTPAAQRTGRGRRRRLTWLGFLASATLCLAFAGIAAAGPANAIIPTDPGGGGGGGPVTFSLQRTGYGCLDDPGNSSDINVHYQVYACNNSAAQKFYLAPGSKPGTYHLLHGSLCLQPNAWEEPFYWVLQYTCGSGAEFDWTWTQRGDGTVDIQSPVYFNYHLNMFDNKKVGLGGGTAGWLPR